jgi:hypothetical protein
MGCVRICFKTSRTLPNFPHDTKSNKELQTVIFCTEGTEFDWHVSRGTELPLWRQKQRCVRGGDTTPSRGHCGHDMELQLGQVFWWPEGCSVLQRGCRSAKQVLCTKQSDYVTECYIRIQLDSLEWFFFGPMPPHVLLNFVVCPLAVA